MKYEVRFSKAAERDVAELLTYHVTRAGEGTARAYVDRLIEYCAGFETFPERGTRRTNVPGLRAVGYRNHATIAFRISGNTVTVIRLFHRGQEVRLQEKTERLVV